MGMFSKTRYFAPIYFWKKKKTLSGVKWSPRLPNSALTVSNRICSCSVQFPNPGSREEELCKGAEKDK